MKIKAASTTFVTAHLREVREFYDRYFDTWHPFDGGWYILISLEKSPGAPQIGFRSQETALLRFRQVPC